MKTQTNFVDDHVATIAVTCFEGRSLSFCRLENTKQRVNKVLILHFYFLWWCIDHFGLDLSFDPGLIWSMHQHCVLFKGDTRKKPRCTTTSMAVHSSFEAPHSQNFLKTTAGWWKQKIVSWCMDHFGMRPELLIQGYLIWILHHHCVLFKRERQAKKIGCITTSMVRLASYKHHYSQNFIRRKHNREWRKPDAGHQIWCKRDQNDSYRSSDNHHFKKANSNAP